MKHDNPLDAVAAGALVPTAAPPALVAEIVADPDVRTILVNGRPCQVRGDEVSHHQLVRLAHPDASTALRRGDSAMTVTYLRGPAIAPEGILAPLERTRIVDGESFSVTRTDRS